MPFGAFGPGTNSRQHERSRASSASPPTPKAQTSAPSANASTDSSPMAVSRQASRIGNSWPQSCRRHRARPTTGQRTKCRSGSDQPKTTGDTLRIKMRGPWMAVAAVSARIAASANATLSNGDRSKSARISSSARRAEHPLNAMTSSTSRVSRARLPLSWPTGMDRRSVEVILEVLSVG